MIVALKRQGLSFTDIATAIGKHRSTIYREVQRKTCWHKDDSYRPIRAQQRTRARRRRSRRNQHFTEKDYVIIRQLLHKQYKKVEEVTNCPYYLANPHHSWERGTNENTNGLIRQYLVKGTSMAELTQQRCNIIAAKLNTRPRKRLAYKTPEECFYE